MVLTLFFCVGCFFIETAHDKMEGQAPISAERVNVKNMALDSLRELIRQTNNEDSKKILELLETKSIMVAPNDEGFHDPIFDENPDRVHLVMLVSEDSQLRFWGDILSSEDTYALFYPIHNAVVLKQMDSFTPLFRAILVDHEGYHALFFQSHDRKEKPTNLQIAEREKDNYEHAGDILSSVGGKKYEAFMREEMKKTHENTEGRTAGLQIQMSEKMCNERLNEIFGPAKSAVEEQARSSFISVLCAFRYIDEYHAGTQTEKETAKTKVLFEAYEKMRAEKRL